MIKSVAIQGIKGSFHHIVSQQLFDDSIKVMECMTFDKVVNSLLNKQTDAGIMAIENSIVGSIIPNYALIDNNQLHIIGEHYIDVQHHLMALPNQSIHDIREVHSHPMALLQCKEFFKKYPHIKLIEVKDTAEVAQRIDKFQMKNVAAVASHLAAELFNLEILSKSIQTIPHNETRFVIVKTTNSEIAKSDINKASLKFELEHIRGSLASVLNVLCDCQLNLTKIQSLPNVETPWKYAFFVDVTFEDYKNYQKAKTTIMTLAQEFKILGEYKNAKP
ncbi:MAG TPA: prephenate dehydratase [Aquaticitalea sp.]|nr:prephenate dehydratase [Aquaticitalea sp.]